MNKSKSKKKKAGELVKFEKQLNEAMQKLRISVDTERSRALFKLVGASKAQELRDSLIQVIKDQDTADIQVSFAVLDWLYRYYSKMNRIFKTGLDDFLDLNLE